jgi:hypothetical protein
VYRAAAVKRERANTPQAPEMDRAAAITFAKVGAG